MNVSVVMPAYNEEKHIGSVLAKMPDDVSEVIVVDDGSWDNTSAIAASHGAKVVKMQRNMGKGFAIKEGVRKATGDVIVLLDADGQHDPRCIQHLVEPILHGRADFVIGDRFYAGYDGVPALRKITNKLTRGTMHVITGESIDDPLSGYRAVRRDLFKSYEIRKKDFRVEIEMINAAAKLGYRIMEVPVPLIYGTRKSKIRKRHSLKIGLELLKGVFRTPLRTVLKRLRNLFKSSEANISR